MKQGREMKIYCNESVTTSCSENYKIELQGGLMATQIQQQQMWSKLPPSKLGRRVESSEMQFRVQGVFVFCLTLFNLTGANNNYRLCYSSFFYNIHSSLPAFSYCLSLLFF
jgi:hypothetical protein